MKNEIKFFETTIQSNCVKFSIQPCIPDVDGKVQPMDLLLVIEDKENNKDIVMNFTKDQAIEILKEMNKIVSLVKCFG